MQVTIDQLEPEVVAALRRRAQAAGRSLEQELREIVRKAAGEAPTQVDDERRQEAEAWIEEARALRKELWGDRVLPDSTGLIREMREERTRQLATRAQRG